MHSKIGIESQVSLLNSIALVGHAHANAVLVSGSHGGLSAAEFVVALSEKPRCVFFNDAGGGKDDAGSVALGILQNNGVPCVCYSHMSARIGEAEDGLENGIISGVNLLAKTLGIQVNMAVKDAVKLIVIRPPSKTPH
jgi:hypothetical protein